jgi:hypothetical protein
MYARCPYYKIIRILRSDNFKIFFQRRYSLENPQNNFSPEKQLQKRITYTAKYWIWFAFFILSQLTKTNVQLR